MSWIRDPEPDTYRHEIWCTGWAELIDGLIIILSAGFLDPEFSVRSALKSLKRGLRRREIAIAEAKALIGNYYEGKR